MPDFYKEKINDPRLTPDMKRCRNGRTQEFMKKDREKAFTLEHPERRELYAELINGEWYWVNGCALCEDAYPSERGVPYCYIHCEKHDVCVDCGTSRRDLKETPWGVRIGAFQCQPCFDLEHQREKLKAVKQAQLDDLDELDTSMLSEIKCPYCGYSFSDDEGSYVEAFNEAIHCEQCDADYHVSADICVEYSTTPIKPIEDVRKAILGDDYDDDDTDTAPSDENVTQTLTDALPARDEMSDVINQAASSEAGNVNE